MNKLTANKMMLNFFKFNLKYYMKLPDFLGSFIGTMKKIKIFNILQKFNKLTKIFSQFLNEIKLIPIFAKIKNIRKLKKVFHNHMMKSKNLVEMIQKIIYKISNFRKLFQNSIKWKLYKHRVLLHNLLTLKKKQVF